MSSDDVNDYLREISGGDFTAKDFRTWSGTVLAYQALCELPEAIDERTAKRNVVEAVKRTAGALRNTAAVSRQAYIHPEVLQAYVDGRLEAVDIDDLSSAEQAVLELLRERLDVGRRPGGRGRKVADRRHHVRGARTGPRLGDDAGERRSHP